MSDAEWLKGALDRIEDHASQYQTLLHSQPGYDFPVLVLLLEDNDAHKATKAAKATGQPYQILSADSWDNPPYMAFLFQNQQTAEMFSKNVPTSRLRGLLNQ